MREHLTQVRVRYSETDQMGVVYHGSYLPYFEIGRVEWLRNTGLTYKRLEEDGIGLPIASLKLDFKKPAKYDDLLTVHTRVKNHSSVKIEFDCEIRNEAGELLTTAWFLLVFIDLKTGKPVMPPQNVREILSLMGN